MQEQGLQDADIRKELLQNLTVTERNATGLLLGLAVCSAELVLGGNAPKVLLSLRSSETALLTAEALRVLYGYRPEIGLYQPADRRRMRLYQVELPSKLSTALLVDCGMAEMQADGSVQYTLGIGRPVSVDEAGYLSALYLEGGRLYTGDGYRLEIAVASGADRLDEVEAILRGHGIRCGRLNTEDKPSLVLRANAIADFLALLGCNRCVLQLYNSAVIAEINKTTNRKSNCFASNLDKAATAAAQQKCAIEGLKANGKWAVLPEAVRQVGEARLQYPQATLGELAALIDSNKSSVYRRMQKIVDTWSDTGE